MADIAALGALGRKLLGMPQEEAACGHVATAFDRVGIGCAAIGWPLRSEVIAPGKHCAANGLALAAGSGPARVSGVLAKASQGEALG